MLLREGLLFHTNEKYRRKNHQLLRQEMQKKLVLT